MNSVLSIARRAARADVDAAGARVEQIEDRVFSITTLSPVLRWRSRDWRGMRTTGTNPTLWDTGDPQTLAVLVAAHHDYPDPDWFGQSITD